MDIENETILSNLNNNYNISFKNVEHLRDGGNKTFIVSSDTEKYFLKVIGHAFFDTVKESINIQLFLSEHEYNIPQIIMSKGNSPYIQVKNKLEECIFILYKFYEFEEINTSIDIEQIGKLVGQLHAIMKNYKGSLIKHDRHFYIDRYTDILHKKGYLKTDEFNEYGERLWQRVKDLPRGFNHGDLYSGNIQKTKDGTMYIMDFDTSCEGFPMYDIALICNKTDYFKFYEDGYAKTKAIYERFLPEYLKYNKLTEKEIASLYDMLAVYHYALQATIIEIYGLDCVDEHFFDTQLDWLKRWEKQYNINN